MIFGVEGGIESASPQPGTRNGEVFAITGSCCVNLGACRVIARV
jgi:hypothetical protein